MSYPTDFRLAKTKIAHMDGYNHTWDKYHLDVTVLGTWDLTADFKAKMVRVFTALLEYPGIEGCYRCTIEEATYDGLLEHVEAAPDMFGRIGQDSVHRFTVSTRTTGSD